MEIMMLRHRPGKTLTVSDRLGTAMIAKGYAIEQTPRPAKAPRATRAATVPQDQNSELQTKLKSELVTMATGLGIALDGSETKADLISRIEQSSAGRYARRDMRASE